VLVEANFTDTTADRIVAVFNAAIEKARRPRSD